MLGVKKQRFVWVNVLWMSVLCSASAWAHDQESRVSLELNEPTQVQAGKVDLAFQLIDQKNKTLIKSSDLMETHTKILHLFVYDKALKEFRHEHPEFSGSLWHASTTLPVNGAYWVWVQGKTADGEEFSSASEVMIDVQGGALANPFPPSLTDLRTGTDGISQVSLSGGKIVAKKNVMLTLKMSRTDGTSPKLSPYLGEMAHVVAVPEDGDSLLHVHPMTMGSNLMLHTQFPEAGSYRLWIQFVDDGVLRTAPLSVVVEAQPGGSL